MKILVVLGSIREGRVGEKVADWVMEQIGKRQNKSEYELLDLKEYPMKLYQEAKHPAMLDGKSSDKIANKWIAKVAQADGYLIITPEYNHGPSAALKNALDYAYFEWNRKAIGFVSYGGASGGIRAVEQLRLAAIELQLVPIRESVAIQFVGQKIEDGKIILGKHFESSLVKTLEQLEWWVKILKDARES